MVPESGGGVTVAALFVDPLGVYPDLVRPGMWWDEIRDARTYTGPQPVVAHPPCQLWVNMAAVNWKRYGRQRPAWYPGGDDGGCFASALASVRRFGGVLEHPAESHAWEAFDRATPKAGKGWMYAGRQFRWLPPPAAGLEAVLRSLAKRLWPRRAQAHVAAVLRQAPAIRAALGSRARHPPGWFDRNKPTLSKRAASATPRAFAEELIRLAEWSRGEK